MMNGRIEVAYESTSQSIKQTVENIETYVEDTSGVSIDVDGRKHKPVMLDDVLTPISKPDFYKRVFDNSKDTRKELTLKDITINATYAHMTGSLYMGVSTGSESGRRACWVIDVNQDKIISVARIYGTSGNVMDYPNFRTFYYALSLPNTNTIRVIHDGRYSYVWGYVDDSRYKAYLVYDTVELKFVGVITDTVPGMTASPGNISNMLLVNGYIVFGYTGFVGMYRSKINYVDGIPKSFTTTIMNSTADTTIYLMGVQFFKDEKDPECFYMVGVQNGSSGTAISKWRITSSDNKLTMLGVGQAYTISSAITAYSYGYAFQGTNDGGVQIGIVTFAGWFAVCILDTLTMMQLTQANYYLINPVTKQLLYEAPSSNIMILPNGANALALRYLDINVDLWSVTFQTNYSKMYLYQQIGYWQDPGAAATVGITMLVDQGKAIFYGDRFISGRATPNFMYAQDQNHMYGTEAVVTSIPSGYKEVK